MKQIVIAITTSLLCLHASAQTKKIAHRSHSGKNSTLILTTDDNFGLPPSYKYQQPNIIVKKKDNIIKKSDSAIKKDNSISTKKKYKKRKRNKL